MSRVIVEEASDSDSDPSEGNIDDVHFVESDILRARARAPPPDPTTNTSRSSAPQLFNPTAASSANRTGGPTAPKDVAHYQMLYPIYFDALRSRSEGRRVPKSLAVQNPLARGVASACAQLFTQPVLEPHKTHPQDWANPGRVRVNMQDPAVKGTMNGKHHLYILVAQYLNAHPTTEDGDVLRGVRIAGMDIEEPGDKWPRPTVPRGWKVNDLLPAYSNAMTGGGISENALQDMMKSMGGMGGAGGLGGAGMPDMAEMMSMLGGGAGPSGAGAGAGGGSGGGEQSGKKGKKGKGKT